jgi:hypothetical protein
MHEHLVMDDGFRQVDTVSTACNGYTESESEFRENCHYSEQ